MQNPSRHETCYSTGNTKCYNIRPLVRERHIHVALLHPGDQSNQIKLAIRPVFC